jgi:hypothetical protein
MQIKMLADRFGAGGVLYAKDITYTVADSQALQWIGDNAAVDVGNTRAAATDTVRHDASKQEQIAGIALVSRARNTVEVWSSGAGPYVAGPVDRTWQLIWAAKAASYAFRISYKNPFTSAFTFDKTTITPSTTFVTGGDPTGGATPVNVLFGGSAACVMPAAASVAEETITPSDWTLVAPVAWTGGGSRSLFHIRTYAALANYPYISSANLAGYTDNMAGGLVRQWGFHNAIGDKIATPAGYVGSGSNQVALPMIIEARQIARNVRILAIGDSTYNCSTYTAGGGFAAWIDAACNLLNNQGGATFYSSVNAGWASQSIAAITQRLPSLLAAHQYDFVFIQTFSPNNAPSTQAGLDADTGRVLEMISRVWASGAIPILTLGIPAVGLNSTADGLRNTSNALWRSYCAATGTALVDIEATYSDGATPARLLPAYSSDGTHITTVAGQAIWATAAAAAVRAAR